MLYLLGLRMKDDDDMEARLRRDKVVKEFMVTVNEKRREWGESDLCGKACVPLEGSLREAVEWAREAKKAAEELEEGITEPEEAM